MTDLTNEYLDNLIKKKIFKKFEDWDKSDFHFLLSLLNYPNYTNLALVILVNLKNWIVYSEGDFFYPLEKLQKILDKYFVNKDIYEELKQEENIKLNIHKKVDTELNSFDDCNDILNIDLDNGVLNFGDIFSIDTFKFFIYVIMFFIVFTIINLYSYNNSINDFSYNREYYKSPLHLKEQNIENLFNLKKNDIENLLNTDYLDLNNRNKNNENNENENFFTKLLDDKYISRGSIIKNILNKAINYIF